MFSIHDFCSSQLLLHIRSFSRFQGFFPLFVCLLLSIAFYDMLQMRFVCCVVSCLQCAMPTQNTEHHSFRISHLTNIASIFYSFNLRCQWYIYLHTCQLSHNFRLETQFADSFFFVGSHSILENFCAHAIQFIQVHRIRWMHLHSFSYSHSQIYVFIFIRCTKSEHNSSYEFALSSCQFLFVCVFFSFCAHHVYGFECFCVVYQAYRSNDCNSATWHWCWFWHTLPFGWH